MQKFTIENFEKCENLFNKKSEWDNQNKEKKKIELIN